MKYNQSDPYATHVPYLIKLLEKIKTTKHPILELGCGYGSTPILHEFCEINQIPLITLESDKNWLNEIKNKFPETQFHKYIEVLDWASSIQTLVSEKYSLIFVDQSPWEARTLSVNKLKNNCEFILLHDCDYFLNRTVTSYSEFGKHWKEFYPQNDGYLAGPPTLICSNYNTIDI